MRFAIRDDDTSYFTSLHALEEAYDFIDSGCISLSVVPFSYPYHKDTCPYGEGYEKKYRDIGENYALVDYLKSGIKAGRYEIMLHGYSHEYRKIDDVWKTELEWKNKAQIQDEIHRAKMHLEQLFDTHVSTFVAPNNIINSQVIQILEDNNLDYSGIIKKNFDRVIDKYSIRNYLHRSIIKMLYSIPWGGVYQYARHKELYAYPIKSMDFLTKAYYLCKKSNQPFVMYTHYWALRNPQEKAILKSMYEYAINDGAELVPMSDCFK